MSAFLNAKSRARKWSPAILEQTRHNGDDLAAIKTRLGRIEGRLDGNDTRFDSIESRLGRVEAKIDGLERNLPKIVGDVMRDVLNERDRKA